MQFELGMSNKYRVIEHSREISKSMLDYDKRNY